MSLEIQAGYSTDQHGAEPGARDPFALASLTAPVWDPLSSEKVACLALQLPDDHTPYTDKYFCNTARILREQKMDPWVKAQVVIRKGPGIVGGIDEALAVLARYSNLKERGGIIRTLANGDRYEAGEAVMTIEGPISSFVELETMYLGVISAATTRSSETIPTAREVDPVRVEQRMSEVVRAAKGTPIIYMGARHWTFRDDAAISRAAFAGGALDCSTQIGADTVGRRAVGTIPHVLENIMAFYHGREEAVCEAALAFSIVMPTDQKVVALIDYNNREISDSVAVSDMLHRRLHGIRIDTCGENIMEGAISGPETEEAIALRNSGVPLPKADDPDATYWYGRGVTVTGVWQLRNALTEAGHPDVAFVLSSGFGDPKKVAAFMRAQEQLKVRLCDVFGVGGVFDSRSAKMDIVAVGHSAQGVVPISKAGRRERPNSRLVERQLPDREDILAASSLDRNTNH